MTKDRDPAPSPAYDVTALAIAPRQRRSHDLSLRILEAAERVVHRDGLEGFTIAAVAAEAKVSVGGIYGRFEGRDELVRAVHNQIMIRLGRDLSDILLSQPFANLGEMIDRFVNDLIDWHSDNSNLLIGKGSEEAANECERLVIAAMQQVADRFGAQITHPDPPLGVRFVVHVLFASGVRNRLSNPALPHRFIPWPVLSSELKLFAKRHLCA